MESFSLLVEEIFKKYLFIYLAVSDVSCVMGNLLLWHAEFPVVVHGLTSSEAFGIVVSQPGIKPLSPTLQGRFLTT